MVVKSTCPSFAERSSIISAQLRLEDIQSKRGACTVPSTPLLFKGGRDQTSVVQAIVARCVARCRNEVAVCFQSLRDVERGKDLARRSRQSSGHGNGVLDLQVTHESKVGSQGQTNLPADH